MFVYVKVAPILCGYNPDHVGIVTPLSCHTYRFMSHVLFAGKNAVLNAAEKSVCDPDKFAKVCTCKNSFCSTSNILVGNVSLIIPLPLPLLMIIANIDEPNVVGVALKVNSPVKVL
jgi:hypothetical protein